MCYTGCKYESTWPESAGECSLCNYSTGYAHVKFPDDAFCVQMDKAIDRQEMLDNPLRWAWHKFLNSKPIWHIWLWWANKRIVWEHEREMRRREAGDDTNREGAQEPY